jgi:hypothetical protein
MVREHGNGTTYLLARAKPGRIDGVTDDFAFGKDTIGASQLAFSILADHCLREGMNDDAAFALALSCYQRFKLHFIVSANEGVIIQADQIKNWLANEA